MRYIFGEWTLDTPRAELCHAGHCDPPSQPARATRRHL